MKKSRTFLKFKHFKIFYNKHLQELFKKNLERASHLLARQVVKTQTTCCEGCGSSAFSAGPDPMTAAPDSAARFPAGRRSECPGIGPEKPTEPELNVSPAETSIHSVATIQHQMELKPNFFPLSFYGFYIQKKKRRFL